jgi:hypothetical protein
MKKIYKNCVFEYQAIMKLVNKTDTFKIKYECERYKQSY